MKFSKFIVLFCIAIVVCYTVAEMLLSYSLGIELSPTLTTAVYAFFGTELAATACIKIFSKETQTGNSSEKSERLEDFEDDYSEKG